MKKILPLLAIFGLVFVSCSKDETTVDPTPVEPTPIEYTSGTADFSNYVAVGASLTAGLSDGALFIDGQTASYPNMLASNFALVGGGTFNIPFMADNLGGLTLMGQPIPGAGNRLILSFASGSPSPVPVSGTGSTEISNVLTGAFNNMGVPLAKSFHLLAPGYGNLAGVPVGLANPFYARFATSPTSTIISDAAVQNPSFFSLLTGLNDLLAYASAGGDGVDQSGINFDPSTYGSNDITDPMVFAGTYDGLLQTLTANGAGGVVGNMPDITTIPYFTTVPYSPLDPTNPDFGPQIPTLNTIYGAINQVYAFLGVTGRDVMFSESAASAVVIKDKNLTDLSAQITAVLNGNPDFPAFIAQFGLPPQAAPLVANLLGATYGQTRQASEEDLIVLPSSSVIGTVNTDYVMYLMSQGLSQELAGQFSVEGISLPLEDKWVLTPEEQQNVSTAAAAYNQTIEALAQQYDLAFVDIKTFLQELSTNGIPLSDGSTATAIYATGGAYSLDGIHPSPRGYALLANLFIESINAKYSSDLPGVNPLDYKGLYIN